MPNKHFYVAVGAAHGAVLASYIYARRHALYEKFAVVRRCYRRDPDWPLYLPFLLLPFSLWGLVPDILHALRILPKEVTRKPLFDVFFFHSTFERWEDENATLDWVLNNLGSAVLAVLGLGVMVFYVRYARRLRQQLEVPQNGR